MPGLFGLVDSTPNYDVAERLRAMLGPAGCEPGVVRSEWRDEPTGVGLGRESLSFSRSRAIARCDGLTVVLDGELYDTANAIGDLASAGVRVPDDPAQLVLHLYRLHGPRGVAGLAGSYSAAIWEERARRLVLVSDRFGTRPMYYVRLPARLLFASRIKPLLSDPSVSRAPNWNGLAQFFTFGHYLRDDTSLKSVRVLPAASWAVYDAASDHFSVQRYWQAGQTNRRLPGSPRELLEQIDEAFYRSVQRQTAGTRNLGLALSGGLDARTILGVMDRPSALKTLCLGMPGSLDRRISENLSAIRGCDHRGFVLDNTFLANFVRHLRDMVRLTDGQYLSQCIVMPTLKIYRELGIEVLLRGHAGELMHMQKAYNYSLDANAMKIRDREGLEAWLWRKLPAYLCEAVDAPLFRDPLRSDRVGLARQALRADIEETAAGPGPAVQQIWRLFVHQRLRRETTLSMMKFRSVVEPRLPYLDHELVELLLCVPPAMKFGEEIQSYILKKRQPSFARIVNANTGTKLGAGPWRRRFATLRIRALAKLGVPGYQPYERLGLWLRTSLAPVVKNVLLSEQCLQRGVFDPDGVRRVVAQHLAGRNHTYLLMALMIFEAGQQYLADEAPLEEGEQIHMAAVI